MENTLQATDRATENSPLATLETVTESDLDAAGETIKRAGFKGVSLWAVGSKWMGCLIGPDYEPDRSTNLWDYVATPTEAVEKLARKAAQFPISERDPYRGAK